MMGMTGHAPSITNNVSAERVRVRLERLREALKSATSERRKEALLAEIRKLEG